MESPSGHTVNDIMSTQERIGNFGEQDLGLSLYFCCEKWVIAKFKSAVSTCSHAIDVAYIGKTMAESHFTDQF